MRHIQLTPEEALAIRWHMGGYDDAAKSFIGGRTQSNAYEKVPLCATTVWPSKYGATFSSISYVVGAPSTISSVMP